jgi:hypothetical protein
MGVLKFQLTSPDPASGLADLRKAYVTGLDRTPSRLSVELRPGMLLCHRETSESGRLFVPWPVAGHGTPIIGTATLSERREPYNLAVELARGKLNDVRNQLADWCQMGLRTTPELDDLLLQALHAFIKSATTTDQPAVSLAAAQASLAASLGAGDLLVEAYTGQVLQTRLSGAAKLPTQLAATFEGDQRSILPGNEWAQAFNAARVSCAWKTLAPSEGLYRFDELDAQLARCRKQQLAVQAGPLLEFRADALPDWIWLWEGDFETILGLVVDLVRQTVQRYRGRIPVWHLVHRPASAEILGLSEEEQIRLSARAIQVARQADPSAQFTIGVERPWAEWMGSSPFQLGPLHLADYLVRADLGLAGIAIEVAPGYSAPGSHFRELFDFSKLLDLYALLNLPLYVWLSFPSAATTDPLADGQVKVETAPPGRVYPGLLGRALDRAGGGQAVRSFRVVVADDRRLASSLSACRALPRGPVAQAAFELVERLPQGPAGLTVGRAAERECDRQRPVGTPASLGFMVN